MIRAALLILLCAMSLRAAPAIVNSCVNGNIGTDSTCTIATTHAGNEIIELAFHSDSGGGSLAPGDTFNLMWQLACSQNQFINPNSFNWQIEYAALGAHSGSDTFTQSSSGSSGTSMIVLEVSGLTGVLDTCPNGANANAVGPALSPTATTTQTGDFLVNYAWVYNGSTQETLAGGTGGYTVQVTNQYGSLVAHATQTKLSTTPGAYSATWTTGSSGRWVSMLAAFIASPSGASISQRRQPLTF